MWVLKLELFTLHQAGGEGDRLADRYVMSSSSEETLPNPTGDADVMLSHGLQSSEELWLSWGTSQIRAAVTKPCQAVCHSLLGWQ